MAYLLIVFPLAMTAMVFAVPSNRWRPWLLPVGALVQLCLVRQAVFPPEGAAVVTGWGGWLLLDPLGKVEIGRAHV